MEFTFEGKLAIETVGGEFIFEKFGFNENMLVLDVPL
jgi:hypothetical protein